MAWCRDPALEPSELLDGARTLQTSRIAPM